MKLSNGYRVMSNWKMLSETMTMRGHELIVDLLVFDIPNIDVIINIDFLGKYGIEIDYKKINVQFSLDGSDEFTFEEGQLLRIMINSVKARKMLHKVCMSYLTHIVNIIDKLIPDLSSTLVVYEFLNVCLDSLSGLESEKEIEFNNVVQELKK